MFIVKLIRKKRKKRGMLLFKEECQVMPIKRIKVLIHHCLPDNDILTIR